MVLDIVTRHVPTSVERIDLLKRQQRSVNALYGTDWTQTLLLDPHQAGINASHVRMRSYEPCAQYAWVLDDDDLCVERDLLAKIDQTADLNVFQMTHLALGVIPPAAYMRDQVLSRGKVGCACVIVSHDLWMRVRDQWGEKYDGDADFLLAARKHAERIAWIPHVIAAVDRVSYGSC